MSSKSYYKNVMPGKFNISTKDKDNNKYYLSGHRYYPKDQIDQYKTLLMVEKSSLEGQVWEVNTKYEGLYAIKYGTEDYEMDNWTILIDPETKQVTAVKEKGGAFLLWKNKDDSFFLQDALTNFFLTLNTEKNDIKRDSSSFYISLEEKEENASKWSFEKI